MAGTDVNPHLMNICHWYWTGP